MASEVDHLESLTSLADALATAGLESVLVGGMALVIHGSRRVTMDFDLLVDTASMKPDRLVALMYGRDYELVTKLRPDGSIARRLDRQGAATAYVAAKHSRIIHFFHPHYDERVDLLLDFPVPARPIIRRAIRVRYNGGSIRVATLEDMAYLKELSQRSRTSVGDAQDLEFLRHIQRRP